MRNLALYLAVLGLFLVGCSQEEKPQVKEAKTEMPPMPVKAYEVKLEDTTFSKTYSALLKPFKEVEVVARINGVLEKENFVEGSFVKKGTVLYEIQKNEFKAALDSAKATQQKAQANSEKVTKDFIRGEYLFKNKAISQQQYDALIYQNDDAKAQLQGAKATLDKAQIEYDYTTIKAPISGLIGISKSDEGTYISTPNSTLTTITALDPVYAEFSLPNSDVLKYRSQIKVGSEVSLMQAGTLYRGVVDFIAAKLDAKTDTLLVRATFKNKSQNLVIGSFTEIKLDGFSYKNVAIIPQYALIKTPEAVVVYVIGEEGALSMRPVEIALVKDGNAIVVEGLNAGEKIVVSNMAKLRPNSKVSIIGSN
ncbi:efflux RND transporter periplasmic adaptor subunit [Sulfurimonas aquatica]|uniref:Efflux RND transporter periplasmic adaptor subunit n=1 Tax=Sulfurimonas aquatica TaxID=2672570 RepID=A0A975AYW3_9BACT|nr:efflux RND transporter periplasmic adaptor subunit [Sulfurimonas aquatica]QSZ41084.1 efflux RND transporter periplasmic adaptor subunit [Sulfurimonas aquatica]